MHSNFEPKNVDAAVASPDGRTELVRYEKKTDLSTKSTKPTFEKRFGLVFL